jgi:hypothetical protein
LTVVLGLLATLPAKVPYGSSGNASTCALGDQSSLLTIILVLLYRAILQFLLHGMVETTGFV